MTEKQISVIVPAYQSAAFLGQAIQSILAQDLRPLEVLVIDDGSIDNTSEIAKSFGPPVTTWIRPHAGPAAARNWGISHAKGELLAFLDADDLWTPNKLSLQVRAFAQDSSLDLVFGHAAEFRDSPQPVGALSAAAPAFVLGTILLRASTFHRVGPLRTDLRVGEFIDWMARSRELGLRSAVLPETFLLRRIHGGNLGLHTLEGRVDYAKLVHQALQRRRHGR